MDISKNQSLLLPELPISDRDMRNSNCKRFISEENLDPYIMKSTNLLEIKERINRVFLKTNFNSNRQKSDLNQKDLPVRVIERKSPMKNMIINSSMKKIIYDFSNYDQNFLRKILNEKYSQSSTKKKETFPNLDLTMDFRKNKRKNL